MISKNKTKLLSTLGNICRTGLFQQNSVYSPATCRPCLGRSIKCIAREVMYSSFDAKRGPHLRALDEESDVFVDWKTQGISAGHTKGTGQTVTQWAFIVNDLDGSGPLANVTLKMFVVGSSECRQ